MNIYYALQTCDAHFNFVPNTDRVVKVSREELLKTCLVSFFESVSFAASKDPNVKHIIQIVDDRSSTETFSFFDAIENLYFKKNVIINPPIKLIKPGVMNSIRQCYHWMLSWAGADDLVYQVQDDYLFDRTAIFEMIDVYYQMLLECNTETIVSSTNITFQWTNLYRNRPTPRTIIAGRNRLWMQFYDMSCSFLTSPKIFKHNYDLFEKFLSMPGDGDEHGNLENVSLNYMLTKRGILGLMPINSLALHMQREHELDLYVDWQEKWNLANEYRKTLQI